MAVPDTTTFNLIDVKNEIESNGGATTNSLTAAFANANQSGFTNYVNGTNLLEFRNYSHIIVLNGCINNSSYEDFL